MNIPANLLYTKEHEWVLIEGNRGRMGITDFAQSHLGDVTYVELPQNGKEVKQFQALSSVDSVKAASDIYAPMSGKVVEVNDKLDSAPDLINKSAYGDGWIVVIEIENQAEKNNLMDSEAYSEYLKKVGNE